MIDRYLFRGFHPCENGTESVWTEGREIKGRWVQGNNIIFADAKKGKRAFIVPKGEHIDDVQTKDNRLILIMPQVEVFPETVGQYIGIEIDGQKVFEGDILKLEYLSHFWLPSVVKYFDNSALYLLENRTGRTIFPHLYGCMGKATKVLGNIHSTPDILERRDNKK